jgi:hypothetical protein
MPAKRESPGKKAEQQQQQQQQQQQPPFLPATIRYSPEVEDAVNSLFGSFLQNKVCLIE